MTGLCIFACSGPGAGRAIAEAIRYGYVSAGITLTLSLTTAAIYFLVRRNYRAALMNIAPMVIHPAWTVSATGGDCGDTKVVASSLWIGLAVGLLLTAIVIAVRRGRSSSVSSGMQFSIKSLLLLTLAAGTLLALLRTDVAHFVPLITFAVLLLVALIPLPQQRRRRQRQPDQTTVDLHDVVIQSRIVDRLRR